MLLVTAAEMRELDRRTIESGHATGIELMERAGAGVVAEMERRYRSLLGLRVLVLCGPGNNGGDGFVVARHLHARGAQVRVGLACVRQRIRDDALHHLERLESEGPRVEPVASAESFGALIDAYDAWDFALDALLGTGARGAPEGAIAAAVQSLRDLDDAGTTVVAVDIPTGLDPDTGAIARRTVRADLTVTFGAPKRGHYLYPGRAFVGALEVVDIGLLLPPAGSAELPVGIATEAEMADLLPPRDPRAHKGSTGRVLVIGGSVGLTGAVALAARAASRCGAGYVQACVPASLNDLLEVKLTEEMTIPCEETGDRSLSLAALELVRARIGAADAIAIGSGMSRHHDTLELARRLAVAADRPRVIDADGLNAFEGHGEALADLGGACVLTPHLGEMERLTGVDAASLEADRIDAARRWARTWRSVVVLKGAPTVIAAPDGRATVNPTGNAGMATAGTGDVLTGIIVALMAQRLRPYDAARCGVFVHGRAGDRIAESQGQRGMIASDLIEALPGVLLELARLRDETLERRGSGTRDRSRARPESADASTTG